MGFGFENIDQRAPRYNDYISRRLQPQQPQSVSRSNAEVRLTAAEKGFITDAVRTVFREQFGSSLGVREETAFVKSIMQRVLGDNRMKGVLRNIINRFRHPKMERGLQDAIKGFMNGSERIGRQGLQNMPPRDHLLNQI